jgi:hypothetical protein
MTKFCPFSVMILVRNLTAVEKHNNELVSWRRGESCSNSHGNFRKSTDTMSFRVGDAHHVDARFRM